MIFKVFKKLFTLGLMCFLFFSSFQEVHAQMNKSFQLGSYYAYVYKVNESQVLKFLKDEEPSADMYTDYVGRISTDSIEDFEEGDYPNKWSAKNKIPQGNYLIIDAIGEDQTSRLYTVRNYNIDLDYTSVDQTIILSDKATNKPIENAKISCGDVSFKYNNKSKTYSVDSDISMKHIRIDVGGFISYYQVDSYKDAPYLGEKRISRGLESDYLGYLVSNKPKYRPNDTIKVKGFIADTKTGDPINTPLKIWLNDELLDTITPHIPGAYIHNFVLTEDIAGSLGSSSRLTLTNLDATSSNIYDSTHIISNYFIYEDYELDDYSLKVRVVYDSINSQKPSKFMVRLHDSNGFNAPNQSIEMTFYNSNVSDIYQPTLSVPSELFSIDTLLNANGETEIHIPNNILFNANGSYRSEFRCLTADNVLYETSQWLLFNAKNSEIKVEAINDSLEVNYLVNGIRTERDLTVYLGNDQNDSLKVNTPAKIKYDPYVQQIVFASDSLSYTYYPRQDIKFNYKAQRKNDRLYISLSNNFNIEGRYQLYRDTVKVKEGYGTEISFSQFDKKPNSEYMLFYKLNNVNSSQRHYYIPPASEQLEIESNLPEVAYPGQKLDIELQVKDYKGEPVENVDLTSYAYKSNFNADNYFLNWQSKYENKHFELQRIYESLDDFYKYSDLNFREWNKLEPLDTMQYYNILYTDDRVNVEKLPIENKACEFTVFALDKYKDSQEIWAILVDGEPVYFSWLMAGVQSHYSFKIKPGKHNITVRTRGKEFTFNKLEFNKGSKHIVSFDIESVSTKYCDIKTIESDSKSSFVASMKDYISVIPQLYDFRIKSVEGESASFLLDEFYKHYVPSSRNLLYAVGPIKHVKSLEYYDGYNYSTTERTSDTMQIDSLTNMTSVENILDAVVAEWGRGHFFGRNIGVTLFERPYSISETKLQSRIGFKDYNFDIHHTSKEMSGSCSVYRIMDQEILPMYKKASTPKNDKNIKSEFLVLKANDNGYWRVFESDISKYSLSEGRYKFIEIRSDSTIKVSPEVKAQYDMKNYFKMPKHTQYAPEFLKLLDTLKIKYYNNGVKDIDNKKWYKYAESVIQKYVAFEKQAKPSKLDLHNYKLISGKVSSQGGNSISKAYVYNYKGDSFGINKGVQTNSKGEFELYLPKDSSSYINVSALGMFATTVKIDSTYDGNIVLEVDTSFLSYTPINIDEAEQNLAYSLQESVVVSYRERSLMKKGGMLTDTEDLDNSMPFSFTGDNVSMLSGLRSDFSDYAFWQPSLLTNSEGKASFTIQLPDDLTAWDSRTIGMTSGRRVGDMYQRIRSIKPLVTQLNLPRFMLPGDSATIIGQSVNYTQTPANITTEFKQGSNVKKIPERSISTSVIDSFSISAQSDSFKVSYILRENDNNYTDGEERSIPVLPLGIDLTEGKFWAVNTDSSFSYEPDTSKGDIYLSFSNNSIDLLREQAQNLIDYRFECNEQLASKLIGYLTLRKINLNKGEDFIYDDEVNEVIKKLINNKIYNSYWGWWGKFNTSYWVTEHVVKALLLAENEGYDVDLSFSEIEDQLSEDIKYQDYNNKFWISNIYAQVNTLLNINPQGNYLWVIDKIESVESDTTLYAKLRLMELKQRLGVSIDTHELDKYKQTTMQEGILYSDEADDFNLFNNNKVNNLIAFNILKNDRASKTLVEKLRGYILSSQTNNWWGNTYESANLLYTFYSTIDKEIQGNNDASIQLSGAVEGRYNELPQKLEVEASEPINFNIKTDKTIYVTAYQKYWKSAPEKNNNGFKINTEIGPLESGKSSKLTITVEADKLANYVMIRVPIPAGCSFSNKSTLYYNNGIYAHVEKYKNEAVFFVEELPAGTSVFEVDLQSRYKGSYTLNPAKVEQMYFPSFNGNNTIKRVEIK